MKTAKDLKIPFTWEDRRPLVLDRFFYLPAAYDYKREEIPFFDEPKEIAIEYCSGNGEWVVERAKQHLDLNWIAVEKKFERARMIWVRLHKMGLKNLMVVCGEAVNFTRFYAPKVVEGYVNFPDPWPKLRHAKHRLIRAEFLEELEKTLKPKGKMTCVTDDANYASEMMREFERRATHWKKVFQTHDLMTYGRSYFKDLWLKKGRAIHFISYEKSDDPT